MDTYIDRHLKKVNTFLDRWQGSHAKIWSYQASHSKLVIRLQRPGESSNLHLVCMGIRYFQGDQEWDNAKIEVVPVDGGGFFLQDAVGYFGVRASNVDVAENVRPLYRLEPREGRPG